MKNDIRLNKENYVYEYIDNINDDVDIIKTITDADEKSYYGGYHISQYTYRVSDTGYFILYINDIEVIRYSIRFLISIYLEELYKICLYKNRIKTLEKIL